MHQYHLDFETRSKADLTKLGSGRYAADPDAEIMLCAVTRDDGEIYLWDKYGNSFENAMALELLEELSGEEECEVWAHNAIFELMISVNLWEKTFGFPPPPSTRYRCTQALCRSAAIPSSLEKAAEFLHLEVKKDKMGKALIRKFSIPQKVRKTGGTYWIGPDWPKPFTLNKEKYKAADAWQVFREYCIQDVRVERQIHKRLKILEFKGWILDFWQLDLRMNNRGVPINREAATTAVKMIDEYTARITEEFREITDLNPTQGAKFLAWLKLRGYPLDNLRIDSVSAAITGSGDEDEEEEETDDELPDDEEEEAIDPSIFKSMTPEAVRALSLKVLVGFAALKKLPTMLRASCADGRLRAMFKFWGAIRTGRYSSNVVQLQNLKRPSGTSEEVFKLVRGGMDEVDLLDLMYGHPMKTLSWAIRHFIGFDDGRGIIVADYSQIEARVLPWLAGHEKLLTAFRAGLDLYEVTVADALGIDLMDVTKAERQLGKVLVLACLARDEMVLTDHGLIPIQEVSTCHRVWDGVEWVNHEGVVFKGVKEVITYQGLTATEDHQVFVDGEETISFGEAARTMRNLRSGIPRWPEVREVDDGLPGDSQSERERVCGSDMRVRDGGLRQPGQPQKRENERVRSLLPGKPENSSLQTDEAAPSGPGPVRVPTKPRMEVVRGAGRDILLEYGGGSCSVGDGQHRIRGRQGAGPGEQQQRVRTGEPQVVHEAAEPVQPDKHQDVRGFRVSERGLALRRDQGQDVHAARYDTEANSGSRQTDDSREEKRLEGDAGMVRSGHRNSGCSQAFHHDGQAPPGDVAIHPSDSSHFLCPRDGQESDFQTSQRFSPDTEFPLASNEGVVRYAPTYDILNAGPRHRFTVSGVLVHNCGYAGGEGAMSQACDMYKMEMEDKEKRRLVKAWRKANGPIVELWDLAGQAATDAIMSPGKWFKVNNKVRFGVTTELGYKSLVMELPSGRRLQYPHPEIQTIYKIKRFRKGVKLDELEEGDDGKEWIPIPEFAALDANKAPLKGVWVTQEISYYGPPKGSSRWTRVRTHGGVFVENMTQATAGDLLACGSINAEKAGYNQFLTVHDEIVTEDLPGNSPEGLVEAMCKLPAWAADFPIGAVGERCEFYTK